MFLNLVIVRFVYKGHRQHSLLLQIRFMDAGKTLRQNNLYIQETRLHSSMFTTGTFSIIFLRNYHRPDALRFILLSRARYTLIGICQSVPHLVRFTIESVHRPHQHIIRNIFQMTTETQPRACHRNMVCGTFTLSLNQ